MNRYYHMRAYHFDTTEVAASWLNNTETQQKDTDTFMLLQMFLILNIIQTETMKASKI